MKWNIEDECGLYIYSGTDGRWKKLNDLQKLEKINMREIYKRKKAKYFGNFFLIKK